MVVFGQKWLYSAKSLYSGESCCIRTKRLYLGKVVVFGQKSLCSEKLVEIGHNWL